MNCRVDVFCFLFFLVLNICFTVVCVADGVDDSGAFFTPKDVNKTIAYKIYARQFKDDKAKIDYLLNLVKFSPYKLIRNGKTYKGKQGYKLLCYKVNKFANEINTVDDFVEKVGSYSRKSGKPYFIKIKDNWYSLKEVYYNELERLNSYTESLLFEKISQTNPVSINSQCDGCSSEKIDRSFSAEEAIVTL